MVNKITTLVATLTVAGIIPFPLLKRQSKIIDLCICCKETPANKHNFCSADCFRIYKKKHSKANN